MEVNVVWMKLVWAYRPGMSRSSRWDKDEDYQTLEIQTRIEGMESTLCPMVFGRNVQLLVAHLAGQVPPLEKVAFTDGPLYTITDIGPWGFSIIYGAGTYNEFHRIAFPGEVVVDAMKSMYPISYRSKRQELVLDEEFWATEMVRRKDRVKVVISSGRAHQRVAQILHGLDSPRYQRALLADGRGKGEKRDWEWDHLITPKVRKQLVHALRMNVRQAQNYSRGDTVRVLISGDFANLSFGFAIQKRITFDCNRCARWVTVFNGGHIVHPEYGEDRDVPISISLSSHS